jgi:hypothetical protein
MVVAKIFKYIGVILGILIFLISLNQYFLNSYDGECISSDIEFSKKKGFYIGVYVPSKDTIILKSGEKVKTVIGWGESLWKNEHHFLFFEDLITEKGLTLVIPDTLPYKSSSVKYDYELKNKGDYWGPTAKRGAAFKFHYRPDTIEIYIKQPLEDSWAKSKIIDSLKYYKLN